MLLKADNLFNEILKMNCQLSFLGPMANLNIAGHNQHRSHFHFQARFK